MRCLKPLIVSNSFHILCFLACRDTKIFLRFHRIGLVHSPMTVPSWAQCDLGTLQIPNGFCPRTGGQNLEGPKKKIRWGFLTMVSSRSPINPLWFSWHILTQSTTRSRFWRWEIIYIYYYIQYIHVIYTGAFHNMYLRYICNVCLYVYTYIYIYIHVYYRGKA